MKLGNDEAKQPSEIRSTQASTFVCMGQSGAGKTTLLETLNDTEYEPVCVLDIDHKAHVLTDRPGKRGIWTINTWDELDKKVQDLLAQRFSPDRFKVVCFDGTTAVQQVLSYEKHKIKISQGMDRVQGYGNSNLDLVGLAKTARLLAEAGTHVIFNIWSTREKDDNTDLVRITPDLTPTLLTRMLGLLDFVVYLEPANLPKPPYPPNMFWGGNALRATRTAASPESPLSHMPDRIENPSWAEIFDSYHGKPFRAKP